MPLLAVELRKALVSLQTDVPLKQGRKGWKRAIERVQHGVNVICIHLKIFTKCSSGTKHHILLLTLAVHYKSCCLQISCNEVLSFDQILWLSFLIAQGASHLVDWLVTLLHDLFHSDAGEHRSHVSTYNGGLLTGQQFVLPPVSKDDFFHLPYWHLSGCSDMTF